MTLKKTQTVTELWQITQNWLMQLGYKANTKFCREEITTHPDYPAITAVIDFLESGSMPYQAVKADASNINEFNYPALAHMQQPGNSYMHIISNAAAWDAQKEITQHWSGIVIFAEKNAVWHNVQNDKYGKENARNKSIKWLYLFTGAILLIASFILLPTFGFNALGLLALAGLVISIGALGAELGYQSAVVKQVCGTISKAGCEQVLKSKYAKAVLGITPADAAVLYFATQFLLYLLGGLFAPLRQGLSLIATGGIAVAVWSIYTQAVKLKQWCALCLGIAAILIAQAIIAISFSFTTIPYFGIGSFVVLFFILALVLLPIKQLIKTNKQNQLKLAELKKWKADAELFNILLYNQQQVDTVVWENDLVIGKKNAPVLITVACNPYCGPCAQAHKQLDDLLHRFKDKIRVQIRFLCNDKDTADKRTVAVKAILQNSLSINDNTQLQQMLTDWFAWMDFEKWNTKWSQQIPLLPSACKSPLSPPLGDRGFLHAQWIQQSNIQFTPAFFINGRKLPGRYNLIDLENLIPQLTNTIKDDDTEIISSN